MAGEWPEVPLGELVQNFDRRRVPLSSREREKRRGRFPYYGATGVMDHVDDFLFQGLHLLVAEDGSVETTEGKPFLQLVGGQFWVNNHAHVLKGATDDDTTFLYYALSTVAIRPYISGSVQAKLSQGNLNRIPIRYPAATEDRRAIARVLRTLDDKIELNRRMNETLEAMARAIFKSWFVDFGPVRVKSEGRDPNLPPHLDHLFPDSFEDSELGPIPRGWHVTSLRQLFPDDAECVLTGPFGTNLHAHDYRPEGVPLILVKHVVEGQILQNDLPLVGEHKLLELDRYRLRVGDIVFTRVGAVGRSALVHERNAGWLISGQLLRVRLGDWNVVHPRYLAQVYLEEAFIKMVESHALGTTRPSLNTQLLREFRFVAPPSSLMRRYSERVATLDARALRSRIESAHLAAIRDALVPKLLSGGIRVRGAVGPSDAPLP
ncbi:MAG: restriction endonuclease subunit S [Acidimicrobiia bacterium]